MLPPPPIRGLYRTDHRARAAYAEGAGIFRILPAAVCVPLDREDLTSLAHWASAYRMALVPRGAGSAMGGGNVGDGIVVDLTALPLRVEVDAPRLRARASASVTLAGLNVAAGEVGLRLPPDPSSGRWATLGGMLSTNAAGARSVRYGSVRRWVEAVQLVTADGETVELRRGQSADSRSRALARFEADAAPAIRAGAELVRARFPRTRKNASGYALDAWLESGDVLDLVVGAEGTLGFVTVAEWRLDPVPVARAGLRIALGSLDALGAAVAALLEHEPSAVELLDRSFLELVGEAGPEAVLLIEMEREDAAAARTAVQDAAAAVAPWAERVDAGLTPAAAERLWALRHAASPILAGLPETRRSLQVIEDGCVPVEQMGAYIRAVREAAAARGLAIVVFGHAGDGHVHVNLLPEVGRAGWETSVASLLEAVTDALVHLGGTPSGEHGDGRLRAGLLARVYGDEIMALFARVKAAFDPLGLLNPGVILPCADGPSAGPPPISRLKVGAQAIALPDDIARGLRRIEQGGGYAQSRLELADGVPAGGLPPQP
ncbi:MAG: FAD-binding oxidoreductase [Gemmatimonadales bacterium]|nr:FAD-binding oxidoreductase [Gemmatimonadales bacterium]